MKTQSDALRDEQAKKEVTVFRLLKIGSYCYTDYHKGVTFDGDTYDYFLFELPELRYSDGSSLDGGEIKLSSVDLTVASLVLNNLLKNVDVEIREQWYNSSAVLIDTELVFAGKVDGRPAINEKWITIKVSAHLNPWTQRFPRTRITKKNFSFIPERGTQFVWGSAIIIIK